MTIVPSSIIVSRAGVLCTRSHFPSSIRGGKTKIEVKDARERERNELTSQTRCVDERKFVWFVGKKGKKKKRNSDTDQHQRRRRWETTKFVTWVGSSAVFFPETDVVVESCRGRWAHPRDVISHPLLWGWLLPASFPTRRWRRKSFFETPKIKIGGLNIQSYERIPYV